MSANTSEDQTYKIPPPVAPYPEFLPLDDPNLPWDRFEAFCEELISRLPGVKETHRYGRRGSRQRGIDIFADLETGERWAFQCRQWKQFTKTDAKSAIQRTSYKADRYILMLSRPATSGVRDVCDSHPNWDVWDVGDISRKVRELPMHSGAILVETHFGASWRKSFLGLQGLTPFITSQEYFRPFLNKSALFNHTWHLVGRNELLREAHGFVTSGQHQVAILVGRGGIGKSKVLYEFAETFGVEHQGTSLWFAAEGVTLTPDSADHLPFEPCVVIVDDAHRRADLATLMALSQQRPHSIKLLLSCRPQGIDYVRSLLTQAGFDVQEVVSLPELEELTRDEVTDLARQALGEELRRFAEQLAAATWDCPLVTVVGGQLLANRAIPPDLLERDEEFRGTVLTRFRDILVGQVGDRIDAKLCRSLLNLIAAVQPIRLDDRRTLQVEAEFLGIDSPQLLRSLGALEEAGVLLRRGNSLRIVPDVLADHILHQASVTLQGQPTGFADLVFDRFASLCPSEMLRNLAELDWRLRWSGGVPTNLLNGIWQKIEQEFKEASDSGRCTILRIVERVSMYQSERTLELVEYAARNPATKPEDPELSKVYEYTHNDVVRHLPALLRGISYTLEFLPRCCNLLWELGRDDERNLGSNPDHPLRVLADLAGYEVGKPFVVNHQVLDAIEKLLETPDVHDHAHSPLEVIDPVLAKAGFSAHAEGYRFVYRPFTLKKENIEPIRQRAISLVVRCLLSEDLRVSLRALGSLENALREPVGAFGLEISDEDREQWRPEQLQILDHIAGLANRSTEPVTHLRVLDVLWWHRNHSRSGDVRSKAEAISSSIPETFEFRLTRELMDPFHLKEWHPEEGKEDVGHRVHQQQVEELQRSIVAEFLEHSGRDAGKAYKILDERIRTISHAGVQHTPQVFLGLLGHSDPDIAARICDVIVEDPDGALAPHLQPLLSNVRIGNAERARGISKGVLEGGASMLCRGVALSYQSQGWADNATVQDVEIIRQLLNHEDIGVRTLAIGAVGALAGAQQRVAIDLAKGVEVRDSVILARELCELFDGRWGIPLAGLTADDLKALLAKLETVQDIDDFHINAFLAKASRQGARAVVALLLKRIRRQGTEGRNYSALPSLGFRDPLTGLATSQDQEQILRDIRDISLEPGWPIEYWVPQLFREISSGFESSAGLKVLDEWVNCGDAGRIKAAARLVSGAPSAFVFSHVEFVSNLLERAYAAGDATYRSVSTSLARSALSGTRSGTPGQPMPQDVAIRDQASAVATQFMAGSPPYRFYRSLAESAEAGIREQLMRDEEMFE